MDYKCKLCGRPGGVEVLDDDSTMFQVEKWLPVLCCNRCGDYLEERRKVMDRIGAAAILLVQSKMTLQGEKYHQVEARIHEKLVEFTKKLAAIVCSYNHKTNVWESDFVTRIIERPEAWHQICSRYSRMIKTVPVIPTVPNRELIPA